MPRTARQCLLDALDDLEEDQFSRFKSDLREVAIKPGFRKIPWGKLEKAKTLDVAKLMVDSYRDAYSGELAVQILREMGKQDTSDNLEQELRSVLQPVAQESSRAAVLQPVAQESSRAAVLQPVAQESSRAAAPAGHPIDQHFTRIVQGFNSVDGVLDTLLAAGVLTPEHYDSIRTKAPKQEKIRELLTVIRGQGQGAKDQLWKAMVETDRYFTSSLTGE
ncbi:apoptosis-associated speck-like protein containing a CARD isoform X1 [Heterodontus francisci]|uniref:apoptosis-associated speck-like protein containing a CARD isoform X1 n=1 Tax=Heterodontus francisci TaxID=7792 RepID=UPI00355BDD89